MLMKVMKLTLILILNMSNLYCQIVNNKTYTCNAVESEISNDSFFHGIDSIMAESKLAPLAKKAPYRVIHIGSLKQELWPEDYQNTPSGTKYISVTDDFSPDRYGVSYLVKYKNHVYILNEECIGIAIKSTDKQRKLKYTSDDLIKSMRLNTEFVIIRLYPDGKMEKIWDSESLSQPKEEK